MITKDYKKIFENNLCNFYTNSLTEILQEYLSRDFNGCPKLIGYKVYIAEQKSNKEKNYILINNKGNIIGADNSIDGMAIKIENLRLAKKARAV